jgi:hypothetical protein
LKAAANSILLAPLICDSVQRISRLRRQTTKRAKAASAPWPERAEGFSGGLKARKGCGMSLAEFDRGPGGNPVDLVERLAAINDWSFERANESEITLSIKGRHTNYNVSFQWMDELEALHTACAFDLKVPEARRNEIYRLLAMVNEQLWLGHFDLWSEEGLVMYRDGLVLSGGAEASGAQCEALLENAVSAAERYYPAFQFVIWAGKTAREAMDATLFETAGEA